VDVRPQIPLDFIARQDHVTPRAEERIQPIQRSSKPIPLEPSLAEQAQNKVAVVRR
jgi:hypothetical protein